MISIHALRVEGDLSIAVDSFISIISIHALRVEGDHLPLSFLHTVLYFYPRPPGGGRRPGHDPGPEQAAISIHALRVEGDPDLYIMQRGGWEFLSTPSGWRATYTKSKSSKRQSDFYPRPPGGGRLVPDTVLYNAMIFLSTPSGWRATQHRI